MIESFKDRLAEALFNGRAGKGFPADVAAVARRRLRMLAAAKVLSDLAAVPGNHLEALKDDRAGQHSIRVNDKWRICFVWNEGKVKDVEVVDYH